MPGGGTRTFLGPELYEAGLRQADIECIITYDAAFNARLTWVELHQSQLIRCEEDLARIGYVSFPPRLACISFPANPGPSPRWRGTEIQDGDIMLHSLGERLHQTTQGPSVWGLITLDPVRLDDYSRTLFEKPFVLPAQARVLRPSRRDAARLRRLHAQACRLAETKPKILSHPEVARAIEQDLILPLVTCLTGAKVCEAGATKRHHALVMIRLKEVLAEHLSQPLQIPELCRLIGVGERTLRSCCAEFLGIGPRRYILLRRLKQVRRSLREADADTASVSELARR
ncbi:MAG: helix-turn-helix domain-containing protein, partial [Alphaproteobacteria bacterium]|nr:helix-turn-helix domain-containing protein [Alphaproteobacteria bacterium]